MCPLVSVSQLRELAEDNATVPSVCAMYFRLLVGGLGCQREVVKLRSLLLRTSGLLPRKPIGYFVLVHHGVSFVDSPVVARVTLGGA